MSKAILAPLLHYRERLIDIMNQDELWDGGRCIEIFGAGNAYAALEVVHHHGGFTKEQQEMAAQIAKDMSEVDSLFDRIVTQIAELAADGFQAVAR